MSLKSKEFTELQKIFTVLPTSSLRPALSWKNKDQIYDLECKGCNAIYSDIIKTNRFTGPKKGSTETSFLTCKNCGASQENIYAPVIIKKNYFEYSAGFLPFPKCKFPKVKVYRIVESFDKNLLPEGFLLDETPEFQIGGNFNSNSTGDNPKRVPLGSLFLNVTDALIASGLNPYEAEKREKLITFYRENTVRCYQDYANFNKVHNKEKRSAEKEVMSRFDKSDIIKKIAENAKFGDLCDNFALGTFKETLELLKQQVEKLEVTEELEEPQEKTQIFIDPGTNLKVIYNLENSTLTRSDGCVLKKETVGITSIEIPPLKELQVLLPEIPLEVLETLSQEELLEALLAAGIVVQELEAEPKTPILDETEQKIFDSFMNKTTGTKSEVNIQEYLGEIFDHYGKGPSVSGNVEGFTINGILDGIVKPPKTSGKSPILIEIKKRVKKIFTVEELVERKYDLCQLVLYKILYGNTSAKLIIVQSFGEEISIERINTTIQKEIYRLFKAGIREFKKKILEE